MNMRANSSTLTWADCFNIFGSDRSFERYENDDLDSIYAAIFGRWPYHMSRAGLIHYLTTKRQEGKK